MSAFANLVNRLNPARRNPEPQPLQPEPIDNREVEIAVLESVGGGHAVGRIVAGTLGSMDDQGRFVVDPAYMPISPVMLYVFGQPIPVDGQQTRVARHVVKAADVAAIRANLMRASAANWSKLYESLGSFAGINPAVLENEKATSLGKVEEHLRQLGLAEHGVPVIVKRLARVEESGEIDASSLNGEILSLHIDPTAQTVIAQTDAMADGSTQTSESERITGLAMGLHEVVIAGAMTVVGKDVEQVERIKGVIVESLLRNNTMAQGGWTLRNPQIQNVTRVETDDDIDDDAEDSDTFYSADR